MGDREGEPGTTWDAERTVRGTRGGGDVIRLHGNGEARNRMRLKSRTRKQGNEGDGLGWFWSGVEREKRINWGTRVADQDLSRLREAVVREQEGV